MTGNCDGCKGRSGCDAGPAATTCCDTGPRVGTVGRPDLLAACRDGLVCYDWADVVSTWGEHEATFRMFRDALRINCVRVTASAYQTQQAADLIGAHLPTPFLLDRRHEQADLRILPQPRPISSKWRDTVEHSAAVDRAIGGRHGTVISPVGKQWCLPNGEVYGWHVDATGAWRGIPVHPAAHSAEWSVIQPVSLAHGVSGQHHDYSSCLILVHPRVVVDGVPMTFHRVVTDPEYCGLALGTATPIPDSRLPNVPRASLSVDGRRVEADDPTCWEDEPWA